MYPKLKITQQQEDSPRVVYLSLYDHHPSSSDGYKAPYVRVPISNSGKVSRKAAAASSVLPPRAVLSSPENDAMHGTKSKKTQGGGGGSALKNHNTHVVKCTKSYELDKTRRSWK